MFSLSLPFILLLPVPVILLEEPDGGTAEHSRVEIQHGINGY